jgi:poly-gamma-glutamate capsule biosynthesis protein CapA/YwtB (metallophosphatase superfamily)
MKEWFVSAVEQTARDTPDKTRDAGVDAFNGHSAPKIGAYAPRH